MVRKKHSYIIGVMGGGTASREDADAAYRLGSLIAKQGWILLNGGRSAGIMEASAKGAYEQGGMTVGILPGDNYSGISKFITIPVLTGMGGARNAVNVLSSHVVVACHGGAGTVSEIALALKFKRYVILLNFDIGNIFDSYVEKGLLHAVKTPEQAIEKIQELLLQAAYLPAW
jgi:uncharacterized protein (TIGR00725 family)